MGWTVGVASNLMPSPASSQPLFWGLCLASHAFWLTAGGRYKQGTSNVRREECALVPEGYLQQHKLLRYSCPSLQVPQAGGLFPAAALPEVSLAFSRMVPGP